MSVWLSQYSPYLSSDVPKSAVFRSYSITPSRHCRSRNVPWARIGTLDVAVGVSAIGGPQLDSLVFVGAGRHLAMGRRCEPAAVDRRVGDPRAAEAVV